MPDVAIAAPRPPSPSALQPLSFSAPTPFTPNPQLPAPMPRPLSSSTLALVLALSLASALASDPDPQAAGTHPTDKVNKPPINNVTASIGFGFTTFKMALHEERPFVMVDRSKTGNARFTGITIDISKKLCEMLKCNLEYLMASETNPESADKAIEAIGGGLPLGSPHIADIAGGAIHITPNRSNFVHFTLPFFDTGYVTVVQRPVAKAYNPWAFFDPFEGGLWAALVGEIIVVGLFFALLEAPWLTAEEESDLVDGHVGSFFDAAYLSFSALTCTLDKGPKSWGGKLVMLGHGWFMLIIIASYTANLATFLTTSALSPSITGWNDVTAAGTLYKIAIPAGLAHDDFLAFEKGHYGYNFNVAANTPTWEASMQAVIDGVADVTFHDEAMVQYYMLNNMSTSPCPLMTVGNKFAPAGYGFAFGLDSTAFLAWSQAILTMKENGEITKIVDSYGVGSPSATTKINNLCAAATSSASMSFPEFHGLFLMTGLIALLGGSVGAFQKFLQIKEGDEGNKVAALEKTVVTDPVFEAALKAGLDAALRESLETAFKAGMEAGLREGIKQLGGGMAPKDVDKTGNEVTPMVMQELNGESN
mmetsp:Transcript_28763/g.45119  ORF Transcript_28763/g.45119 Transcript_28763/m.45119 type:complete len:592 (+) Transcript_28763:165-1940(+)